MGDWLETVWETGFWGFGGTPEEVVEGSGDLTSGEGAGKTVDLMVGVGEGVTGEGKPVKKVKRQKSRPREFNNLADTDG